MAILEFSGLTPYSESGNKEAYHGALMANRRKNLQWILLETVFHFIKATSKRHARYEELKIRKGANTAKVIMARQYLKIIYHVLKEQRPYYREESKESERPEMAYQIQSVAAA